MTYGTLATLVIVWFILWYILGRVRNEDDMLEWMIANVFLGFCGGLAVAMLIKAFICGVLFALANWNVVI